MNRFLEIQGDLTDTDKKKKKKEPIVEARNKEKAKAHSFESPNWFRAFNEPAYSLSANPMNDEREIDEDLISRSASVNTPVPSFCQLNNAKDANTTNFALVEFNCKDAAKTPVPESIRGNVQQVMEQLEILRTEVGKAITVTSGYRTVEHNKSVGGEANSLHLCGMAADIKIAGVTPTALRDTIERLITAGKMKQGGIGLYNTFVHYDIRGTKARWDRTTSAGSKSYYGVQMSAGYFDWPDKFGKGNADYDTKAAAWVTENRAAITQASGLKRTTGFLGGYSYLGNSKTDPTPNWGVSDPAHQKVYDEIRKELFSEGGASSINTYDDQIVTIGWGFSMRAGGAVQVYENTIASSTGFSNELLKVGMTVRNKDVLYLDTTDKKIVTGQAAMQKIRWDAKVLSKMITAMETYAAENTASQVKIFKEIRMKAVPAEAFKWPTDSVRLAVHLSHWLPVGIRWSELKTSNGDVATIIKSFCKNLNAYQNANKKVYIKMESLPNGALYITDNSDRFDMGNRAFIKAGDAGLIKRIPKADFTEKHKTEATYRNYYFVELYSNVYLLP